MIDEPTRILIKNYFCKARRNKNGFYAVFKCSKCQFLSHDKKRVLKHSISCRQVIMYNKLLETLSVQDQAIQTLFVLIIETPKNPSKRKEYIKKE